MVGGVLCSRCWRVLELAVRYDLVGFVRWVDDRGGAFQRGRDLDGGLDASVDRLLGRELGFNRVVERNVGRQQRCVFGFNGLDRPDGRRHDGLFFQRSFERASSGSSTGGVGSGRVAWIPDYYGQVVRVLVGTSTTAVTLQLPTSCTPNSVAVNGGHLYVACSAGTGTNGSTTDQLLILARRRRRPSSRRPRERLRVRRRRRP